MKIIPPKKPKKFASTLPKRDAHLVFNRRAMLLTAGGAGAMGAIGARIAHLQATDLISRRYSDAADQNRYDTRIIAPPRGVIYDRFGEELAITRKNYQVSVIREDVGDLDKVVRDVGALLGLDEAWARRAVRDVLEHPRYEAAAIRRDLTWEEFNAIAVRLPDLPGVVIDAPEQRAYPFGRLFAHPIGYVQKPTQRDIDTELAPERGAEGQRRAVYLKHPDVRVGKSEIEYTLEHALHGEPGWQKVVVNAHGRETGEDARERREPERGSGVVLTLDAELQRVAMENFGQEAGAAVVMDILTGDILVMASAPSFDPNDFVNGIGQDAFRALNEDMMKPLFHKAVTGAYPPGSTFKTMVGIAAKQAGVEDDWRVSCPGYFNYGGRAFHCWRRGGHGSVNMHQALKVSCDVFFYNAALRAGPERIAAVAREFGYGLSHDVSLPRVEAGVVPDPAWMLAKRKQPWTGGLTLNYGIGQGDLLVTPLQMCVMTARIANNGRAVVPRLVREPHDGGAPVEAPQMHNISPAHLAAIRRGMFGVCNEGGTATRAGAMVRLARRPDGAAVDIETAEPGWKPVQMAGKTGTAQVRIITAAERARGVTRDADLPWNKRDHIHFVGFGPWDAPRYAVAVVVEHGGHVNPEYDAAPIAAKILRETFKRDPARRAPAQLTALEARAKRSRA